MNLVPVLLLVFIGWQQADASDAPVQLHVNWKHDFAAMGPERTAFLYNERMWHSSLATLSFKGGYNYTKRTVAVTKGRRVAWSYLPAEVTTPGTVSTISLSLHDGNPLWTRWRYAVLTNLTFTQTSDSSTVSTIPRAHYGIRVACSPTVDVFCDAGMVEARSYENNSFVGTYNLTFRPDVARSSLPPHLFFFLTSGRFSRLKQATTTAPTTTVGEVCVRLVLLNQSGSKADTLVLCDDDTAHFDLAQGSTRDTIVIGGSFWRSNYSVAAVDGLTAALALQFTTAAVTSVDPAALANAAVVVVSLGMFLCFAFWTTDNRTTLSYGRYNQHVLRGDYTWPISLRFMLISTLFMLMLTIASLVVAWLGYQDATVPLSGPNFQTLIIGLTVYGSIQTLALFALAIFDASNTLEMNRVGDWLREHRVDIDHAWARQMMHVTAASAWIALASTPSIYLGGEDGDFLVLYTQIMWLAPLLFFGTYYLPKLVATSFAGRSAGYVRAMFAFLQLLLWAGSIGVVFTFYVFPMIDASSPFFSNAVNWIAATMIILLLVATAPLIASREKSAIISRLKQGFRKLDGARTK
jgi:hypothetical protein